MRYNNFHKHTHYSNIKTLDCISKPEDYMKRAVELGHTTYFTTEHGFQGNIYEAHTLCEQYGLKCIYGVEAYYVDDMYDKSSRSNYHLMLVAMNDNGRKEINKIMSLANTDGFYYKPRIDLKCLLSLTPTDVVVTTACFTKGNKVLTNKGYKNIEDIRIGDYVKNKYGEYEYVNFPTKMSYKDVGYKIKLNNYLDDVTCTKDHKFLMTTQYDIWCGNKPYWTEAQNLLNYNSSIKKPILLYPIKCNYTNKDIIKKEEFDGAYKYIEHPWSVKYTLPNEIKLTNELMRFFGYFIGNGHITLKKNIRIGLTIDLKQYQYLKDDIFDKVEEQLNIKFSKTVREKNNRVDLTSSSVDLINLFYYLFGDCKAETKHIPNRLFHVNKDLDYELFLGMCLSDGHFQKTTKDGYKSGRLVYSTISKTLTEQLCDLLDTFQIKGCIEQKKGSIDKNNVNHQDSYKVCVNHKFFSQINKCSNITHEFWVDSLNNFYKDSNITPFISLDNTVYKKVLIKNQEKIEIDDEVYCLNNNSHSFVLNGVVVHNCVASPMFKGDNWLNDFLIPVHNHFGKNFYLEVQNHNELVQIEHNKKLLAVRKKYGIQLIHANDSHYIKPEDAKYRDLFLNAKGMHYEDESNFILDYPDADTVIERYHAQGVLNDEQIKEALENTLIFDNAESIKLDKEFKIPKITNGNSDMVLRKIISEAWREEKKGIPKERIKEYEQAIYYEMDIIKNCGMADYFILDHKIIKKAVNEYNAVLTRSGRGSAVSFYVNRLLGLTEIDRLKSPITLYPTRFMSAERILSSRSLPDIDLNFADVEPVIKASKDILGEDGIYYMVAYKPLQESSAFRLWCKANGYHIDDYNEVAKDLENHLEDKKWKQVIEDSKIFRGVIESIAPSPCSFLLLDKPISEEVGLIRVGNATNYTMCCAIDGYNCDVYKYLKNDYLTVKVYEIIDKVYKLIGRPIDDIGTLLSNCDDKVWNIYANALTTTINQSDSDFGKQTLKRYKPTSLAEMSAWVAAIRPGFASLLNNFLDRLPYTTGVKELDDILEDSFHYLTYQESIMKYLVWLGIEEKGTYDIIKKIAKKKFKEKELEELKSQLLQGWVKNVGVEDGFSETWQVVEDAAHYSFNASHSLSVAIDSIYGAYLKSHYPLEYFTVVLSMYADDIDRTSKLIEELPYFGITIQPIKYSKSGSSYTMDKETNTIYKGISSVKYCNAIIAEELLELSKSKYSSFIDLLKDIKEKTSVNSRQLEILIKLNFFSNFGNNKYLLNVSEIYDKFANAKIIAKKKMEELGVTEFLMAKYAGKETASQYRELDNDGLIKELCEKVENESLGIVEQISSEIEFLGYVDYINRDISEHYYIVTNFDDSKSATRPYCTLYRICDGEKIDTRINRAEVFKRNPFGLFSVISMPVITYEYKKVKDGDKWVDSDEMRVVMSEYEVMK